VLKKNNSHSNPQLGFLANIFARQRNFGLNNLIRNIRNDALNKDNSEIVNEANLLNAFVGCPQILQMFGILRSGDVQYMVCERLNCSLYAKLNRDRRGELEGDEISLSPQHKIKLSAQIACGMKFLEDNLILHRDLRTPNILLDDTFQHVKHIYFKDISINRVYVNNIYFC
jgi:serine/threonine protein kinase